MAEMGFRLNLCTIQRQDGSFCDGPVQPDCPFSVCRKHVSEIATWVFPRTFMKPRRLTADGALPPVQLYKPGEQVLNGKPFVYYVLLPHHLVKIGFSADVPRRLQDLRVRPDALLAVEPGDRSLERQRHEQFRHLLERWNEEFRPAAELQDHVAELVATHGSPWAVLDYSNTPLLNEST